jgi:hypothetical protein
VTNRRARTRRLCRGSPRLTGGRRIGCQTIDIGARAARLTSGRNAHGVEVAVVVDAPDVADPDVADPGVEADPDAAVAPEAVVPDALDVPDVPVAGAAATAGAGVTFGVANGVFNET